MASNAVPLPENPESDRIQEALNFLDRQPERLILFNNKDGNGWYLQVFGNHRTTPTRAYHEDTLLAVLWAAVKDMQDG